MNVKQRNIFGIFLIFLISITLMVGCSDEQSNSTPAPTSNEDNETTDSEYPIVIEHGFGETVIESKPERVVTIQWGNHDVVLALGIEPVGFSAANYGVQDDSGLLPWTAEKLDQLGITDPNVFQDTDGLDFEAISDANPDVILAAYSGITEEDYDLLSQIAPVVAYPIAPWTTSWRDQIVYNATGMGMKAEGDQLIKDIEDLIEGKLNEYTEIKGKKVAWVNFSATDMSDLHIYTPTDPRVAFLYELGMVYSESITNEITDPSSYALNISAENADILYDSDIIIGYGGEDLYEAVKADSLFGKIPAIERGSVVFIGDSTPLAAAGNPNPLSISYTIDEYLALIDGAIDKLDE